MKLIVAIEKNRGIGRDGILPWHHSSDLKRFRELTSGNGNNCIIMGRNTYESIGKPLPNRTNVVLTSNTEMSHIGLVIMSNINDVLVFLENSSFDDVWIIGGAMVYNAFLDKRLIQEIYVTKILKTYECDVFLREFDNEFVEDTAYTQTIISGGVSLCYEKLIKISGV
tara:strand:- start:1369 stop:1872 length:504 start_codon:yes stop_codon:yes gene_type:complete